MSLPVVKDPREEIDEALVDALGVASEVEPTDVDLSDLWEKPTIDEGMSSIGVRKLQRVGAKAHIVLRRLCMKHYGEYVKDWPEDAREVMYTLSLCGCKEDDDGQGQENLQNEVVVRQLAEILQLLMQQKELSRE